MEMSSNTSEIPTGGWIQTLSRPGRAAERQIILYFTWLRRDTNAIIPGVEDRVSNTNQGQLKKYFYFDILFAILRNMVTDF